ncbi:MAG: archease [Nitrospirae bacterium]|nr:archease [Nitrospirota bacterium]
MKKPDYRQVEHTADLAIEVYGATLRALYRNAILAYFDLITTPNTIRPRRTWRLKVRASSPVDLLYQLLREVHYRQQAGGWLGRRVGVSVNRAKPVRVRGKSSPSPLAGEGEGAEQVQRLVLNAVIEGERFDPARHELKDEIKAVTLHGLSISRIRRQGRPCWKAFVVFDV